MQPDIVNDKDQRLYVRENLHTHTFRCNHATGTEREYIEEAVRVGFTDFGFSDHTPMPWPADKEYPSHVKMRLDEMPDYCDTILALREEYKDRINIYLGLEVEYYPKLFPKLLDELRQYPLEYMILGEHNYYNGYDGDWCGNPTDDTVLLKNYVDQCIEALETGYFIYLAHPDLVNFTGERKIYLSEMERLCIYAHDHNIPLELNLYGLSTNRNYPDKDFWELAGQVGNDTVIGLDAHFKEMIDVPDVIKRAMALIDHCHLNLITNPSKDLIPGRPMW
ncbi:MAG: histidinol-phosphatase [Lachnospiraceae bacterium]|nr:histidinol-phosphatase [Lachnospiraceae bacterium]